MAWKETLEDVMDNRAVRVAAGVAYFGGIAAFCATRFDRQSLPAPIADHIGDFCHISNPVYFTGMLAPKLEDMLDEHPLLAEMASYLPEAVAIGWSAYFTLGETLFDIIPFNYRDPWDVPAVLVAGVSSYIVARAIRNDRF